MGLAGALQRPSWDGWTIRVRLPAAPLAKTAQSLGARYRREKPPQDCPE